MSLLSFASFRRLLVKLGNFDVRFLRARVISLKAGKMVRARMVIQRGSYDDDASESEEEGNGVANDSDASSDPALPSGENPSILLALIGFSFSLGQNFFKEHN